MHLPSPTITPIETESLPKKQSGLEKVPIPTFGMINPSAAIRSSSSCAVLLATPSFLASTLLEGIRILLPGLCMMSSIIWRRTRYCTRFLLHSFASSALCEKASTRYASYELEMLLDVFEGD